MIRSISSTDLHTNDMIKVEITQRGEKNRTNEKAEIMSPFSVFKVKDPKMTEECGGKENPE